METHAHLVLDTRPEQVKDWNDETCAHRYLLEFEKEYDAQGQQLSPNPDRVEVLCKDQVGSKRTGALLYMDDVVQENWLHAIPKQKGVGPRISLTFRHIIK